MPSLAAKPTAMGEWPCCLVGRAHKNKVVVALAGKLARIAWAVLRSGESYAAKVGLNGTDHQGNPARRSRMSVGGGREMA